MEQAISGGCRCGQLRYEVKAKPIASIICHCDGCQRRTGAATGAIFVPSSASGMDGAYGSYLDPETSTPISILFCSNCGSSVAARAGSYPAVHILLAASLDDARHFTPLFHMWVSKKPHWVGIDDDLPQFAEHPEWEKVGGLPDFGTMTLPVS